MRRGRLTSSYGTDPRAIELRALQTSALGRRPVRIVSLNGLRDRRPFAIPCANPVTRGKMAQGATHPSGPEHPGEALILRQVEQLALRAAVPAAKVLKHRLTPLRLPRGKGLVKPPAALFRLRQRRSVPSHS